MSAIAWIEEHRSAQALQQLLVTRGAQVAVVVLLAAIAIEAAFILTNQLSRPAPPVMAVPPPRAAVNPALELATIVNAHLFGRSRPSEAAGDAPTTTMPLVLAGVLAVADPSKGQAIIGQNPTAAKLYAVGAQIPGGARLHAVYADRVLLERNGGLETLLLPRTQSPPPAGGAPSVATAQIARANLRDNATLFSGLVRVQPVFMQGKLSGYRIFPGPRGSSVLNQLGLRAGDLITAVNGTALDDQGRAMEIIQTLGSASTATVTVSRNGQQQEVNLNLTNLAADGDNNEASAEAAPAPAQNRPGVRSGGRPGGQPPGPAPDGGGGAAGLAAERPPSER
ncbi:MAG: type II secretion system protein GspC [Steroidobacterales bacterium]